MADILSCVHSALSLYVSNMKIIIVVSIATAEMLYNQCDGLEYEHSSSILDVRYSICIK